MKRDNLSKNRPGGWAGTGVALVCLLSPLPAQEAGAPTGTDSAEAAEAAEAVEAVEAGNVAGSEGESTPESTEQPSTDARSEASAAPTESSESESEEVAEASGSEAEEAEVETARPLSEDEALDKRAEAVLAQAPQMEVEQIEEMIQVFQRLGNDRMVTALSEVLLEKDPNNEIAVSSAGEEDDDYVEDDADDSGPSVMDLDAQRAEQAIAAGRHAEAVTILSQLKASNYNGQSFPQQQDLAYALLESGQTEAARSAFEELASDQAQPATERADARSRLVDVRVKAESERATQLMAQGKSDEAIALVDDLLRSHPDNESALALKADVLSKSGRHDEAAVYLKELKKRQDGSGPFVFQQALAYAVYESEGRAESQPYFVELAQGAYPQEQRQDAADRIRDFKVERIYETGLKAIKGGDPVAALSLANKLMQLNPSPNEAYELKVLALKAQRRFKEAAELLEQYKRNRFADKPFPMEGELADCYAGAGQFLKAKRAYDSIIEEPSISGATDIQHATLARADLAQITDPYLSFYSEGFNEEEGQMFRAEIEGRTGIIGIHQFAVRGHSDFIELGESFIENGSYDRWDASATYTATLPNRFYVDVTGGGSEDEFLYGGGIGRHALAGLGWKLYFAGNERATDSLTLEALDGRQDAVHFDVTSNLEKDWSFDGRFNARQVKIDGTNIGDGFQADVQFGKTIRYASPVTSGVYVGYVGEYSEFDYDTPSASELRSVTRSSDPIALTAADILGSLVSEEINRHGIEVAVERQITPRIAASIVGGLGWAFEEDRFVYRGGVNVNYKLRENIYIQASVDYDSSGTASSSGSGVLFASIMLRIFF